MVPFFLYFLLTALQGVLQGDGVQNKTMEVEEVVLPTLNNFHEIK